MIKKKPWLPKILYIKDDGGPTSGVRAFCLIEWKRFFTIALLRFEAGSREVFHSHAFDALSWVISGSFVEERLYNVDVKPKQTLYKPSIIPKVTLRDNVHRVVSNGTTWVFTIRGPWKDTWVEYRNNLKMKFVLSHNRSIVSIA